MSNHLEFELNTRLHECFKESLMFVGVLAGVCVVHVARSCSMTCSWWQLLALSIDPFVLVDHGVVS